MNLFLTRITILAVVVIGLAGFAGCQESGAGRIEGSGVRATQERHLPPFTGVVVELPANLRITCGTAQTVTIAADDNLLPHIATRVEGGVLVIASEPSFTTRQPITIDIGVTGLRLVRIRGTGEAEITGMAGSELQLAVAGSGKIHATGTAASARCEVSGAGQIDVSGMAARELQLITSGSGRLRVAGTTAAVVCWVSGAGAIDGAQLIAETVVATVSGSGTITTAPTVELDASISGSGTITYAGRPQVRSRISGSGTLREAATRP